MSLPRTARRSARMSPAPAPRQISPPGRVPPRRRGLGGGAGEIAVDLRLPIRGLGVLAGQRRVRRGQRRNDHPGQEPQVGAQRPPGHPRQPRRVRGKPLDHRGVQQHPWHRIQAQPDRPVREPACGPQQVLRPFPPTRRRLGHDCPGEASGLRGHRGRLPAGDVAGDPGLRHLPPPGMSPVKYCGQVGEPGI